MFFWKKSAREKQIRERENSLVIQIISELCKELPKEYNYLSLQFHEGIIAGVRKDFIDTASHWGVHYNSSIINKYENRKCKDFTIDNIYVSDSKGKYKTSILVISGCFAGVSIEVAELADIDLYTIDVKGLTISRPKADKTLQKLFTEEELKYLNTSDIYEVKLEDKAYYHLFDFGDGDFIVMDKKKNVYKITHDPYEIDLLETNLLSFLKNWKDGNLTL